MNFQQAAQRQHLYATIYTVFLVGPDGAREPVGTTSRKSGTSLLDVLARDSVQERVKNRLEFSNGWQLVFGGTIRQEAS